MQLSRDFNLELVTVFVLDELAVLVRVDQSTQHGEALCAERLDLSLKLSRGEDPAGFLGKFVFFGFGIDDLTASILVGCLDEHFSAGGAFAFQRNLHPSRSSQRLWVTGELERSAIGQRWPA